jgi:hypothetical protein
MGVMFCMLDQRQSADDHFTIEYAYSHASETQDEAKAPRYDPKGKFHFFSEIFLDSANYLRKSQIFSVHFLRK